ncbi:MAG: hypothetical protein NWF11_06165 [Candidatus Bathyarchaeota archaeon]|nr:hypothetical protein [Candidatus Bathyarchaeota archaeon]
MTRICKNENTIIVLILLAILSFVLVFRSDSVKKSFAMESYNVEVYWDAECKNPVTSVDWGELSPGSTKSTEIFVRNEQLDLAAYIFLWTQNWAPKEAQHFLKLDWDYDGRKIAPDENLLITLTLDVDEAIYGVKDFGFDIIIFGADYIVGDINGDKVVDIFDLVAIGTAWDTTPSDSNWNSLADLDQNGIINIFDVTVLARNWGIAYQ